MSVPYRSYLYVVLTVSAFVAITGAVSIASYAIDESWPGRVLFGRSTTDLASGLARLIVAGPIWFVHWRLARRQIVKDGREAQRLLRQGYLLILLGVSIISTGVAAQEMIAELLGGGSTQGGDLSVFIVWGLVWVFHWRTVRVTWRAGDPGWQLHRWYLYGLSAGSLVMLAFGVSSVLAELLRFAYESSFTGQVISVSGPWTRDMQEGLANSVVGGVGWSWHWWRSARGDVGSVLREVYATGAAVAGAASAVSAGILLIAVLLRPAFGHSTETLVARWDSLPRLAVDVLVASAIWIHLSPASRWSRRGVEPREALPGATAVDIGAWEIIGLGAIGAGIVIAIALLLSLPVATTRGLLVDVGSRFDALSAILASAGSGVLIYYVAARRGKTHDAGAPPQAGTVTRFFHFGIAAAGLLAAVGGAAAALFVFIQQALDRELGTATLLDARWGVGIGLVGGILAAWRWRAIQSLQLRAPGLPGAPARPRPRVRVIHPDAREVEVSSGAMSRLAGVSKGTVGAEGIHLVLATIPPGHRSSPHYHTNCESAIYVASGHGTFRAGDDLGEALPIGPGDFIYVPADAPHQPVNGSETEPLVLIVARDAPEELVVELPEAPSKPE